MEAEIAQSIPQPAADSKKVFNLGDKVNHACWGKECKGKSAKEYTIDAFKATKNSKSAFAIGTCPDCGKKISKIVTVIPQAPAVVVEENGDQPKL